MIVLHHIPSGVKGFRACPRSWRFNQIPEFQKKTQAHSTGDEVHKQRELYFKEGKEPTSEIARSGLEHLPEKGVALDSLEVLVEHKWETVVDNVCVPGTIDLVDFRNPLRPRVIDHKTTSSIANYALNEREIATDPQLNCYAWHTLTELTPNAKLVYLEHHYTQTRGRTESKHVHALVTRDSVEAQWEGIKHTIRQMHKYIFEDPAKVPGNPEACGSYGGCPHRLRCSIGLGKE